MFLCLKKIALAAKNDSAYSYTFLPSVVCPSVASRTLLKPFDELDVICQE